MLLVLSFYDTGNCDFLYHKKNICLTNVCSRCIISVNSGEKFMISKAFQSKEACLMSITWDMDIEEKLKILADYFGVSIEYFLEDSTENIVQ